MSEGNGINYFGSYISTLNPSNPWFFGILETGQLVICHKEFNKKHIRWYSTTTIPDTEDINAYELNVEFKIANNGHLIMTAENILDDYTIEEDDIYKVDTSQEIVIWDSLPKHLPFNVGHFGDNGYTLMIKEIDNGKSCEVILYDGLLSPVWRIKPSNSNYGADIYRGYAFPIEYNLPLKVDTAKAETNYDIHNYININVKNKYESELPFKCDIIFNENEKMVSKNGKYSFYLQPSGNLVVKENDRTMWSSDTAFVEPFESPFTLSLSPIGELILRDKHNYIVWQTINPFIITKYDGNLAEDINDNNENNNDISNFNNTDINNNKNNNDNSTFNNTEINNNNVIIDNNDDDSIGLGEIIDPYDPYDDMISDNINYINYNEEDENEDDIIVYKGNTGNNNNDNDNNNNNNNNKEEEKEKKDNNNDNDKNGNEINQLSFKLKLTDNGELKIVDTSDNIIWSNWFIRKNNYHMRYVEPLVYSISSCNEELRLPYIYNMRSYEQPDHKNIIVDPYYNNLLPGEKLVYQYDNNVYLSLNKTQLTWVVYDEEYLIESCDEVKELKILDNGLFLHCKTKSKIIASLPSNKRYTLTIKTNLRNNDYRLVIMDMDTNTFEWGYEPIKFLNSLENREHIYYGKIDVSNYFTTYDRLLSIRGDGRFAYLSNNYGLQLIGKGFLWQIYEMKINETSFSINDSVIVNNTKDLKLEYDSEPNALLLSDKPKNYIWKYHGSLICDYISSAKDNCNGIYSLTPLYRKNNTNPWLQLDYDGKLYGSFDLELLNIQKYLNVTDPIYSLILNKNGDIVINGDKYLHKEYHRIENYYTLELINSETDNNDLLKYTYIKNDNNEIIVNNYINNELTLALKSSRGEYKWCNNYIINRPIYASRIYIGDSFIEGEMLYCNSYSLIVLEGKLIYRNHVDGTEKVVYSVPNVRLTSLAVTDRNIVLLSDNKIQYTLSDNLTKSNTNSFLSCDFSDNSVYWDDGNGKVLWKYSINNSPNSGSNAVFLYNKYYNKCLYAEPYTNEPITYEDCKDKNKYKWYYVNIDGNTYFKSASKENLCIRVNKNRIVLGNCDKNAIIKYIKTSKFIKRDDKCVSGIDDNDDLDSQYYVKLNNCDRHNKKQLWEFISDINDISN